MIHDRDVGMMMVGVMVKDGCGDDDDRADAVSSRTDHTGEQTNQEPAVSPSQKVFDRGGERLKLISLSRLKNFSSHNALHPINRPRCLCLSQVPVWTPTSDRSTPPPPSP